MNITPEMMVEDEKRWYARDVITELSYCGNCMRDRKDMTNLDIRFYAYLMRKAYDMLKAQEPRVMTKSEVEQYLSIASNGFQAAEVDEPPLWTEYKSPQKYDVKWVTFGTVYSWMDDLETSLDYGTEFRFWTGRPTPEMMANTPWEGSE